MVPTGDREVVAETKEKRVYTEEQTRKYEEKRAKQKERQKAKKKELKESKESKEVKSKDQDQAATTGKQVNGEELVQVVKQESTGTSDNAKPKVDLMSGGSSAVQNGASSSSSQPLELSIKGRAEKADGKKKKPVKTKAKDVSWWKCV